MKTTLQPINYFNLLLFLQADYIKEVRKVKSTYLVRYTRNGRNCALFVATNVVEAKMTASVIEDIEALLNSKSCSRVVYSYSRISKKIFVQNTLTGDLMDYLLLEEVGQADLRILTATYNLEANRVKHTHMWLAQ
jgi:hypothetical protein